MSDKNKVVLREFDNPPAKYRGVPFWSWNDVLEKEELLKQIDELEEMGFGGFNMHTRNGLNTEYLGEEYMDCVKACCERAKEKGMLAWVYDEDGFPSGWAGGLVTRVYPYYRIKRLVVSTTKNEEVFNREAFSNYLLNDYKVEDSVVEEKCGYKDGKSFLLSMYDVVLDDKGILKSYKPISLEEEKIGKVKGKIWYAYLVTESAHPGMNYGAQLDCFMDEAVKKFIEVTYERYYNKVGEYFGDTIPAFFTDESTVSPKTTLSKSVNDGEILLSWTTDYSLSFKKDFGYDLVEKLPEIFFESKKPSKVRYDYFKHCAERFAKTYFGQIRAWCEEHGVKYGGHLFFEDFLLQQVQGCADVFLMYEELDIPGLDVLRNRGLFHTAKQVQSVTRQLGKEGMLSELYGVTDWDFDFRGHKWQGDWQAALGVTVRVPHLSWYSMRGTSKRDYPGSIHYQSSWYREYTLIEDHFARLNAVLTKGKPQVRVALLHPLESYWTCFGPNDFTSDKRGEIQDNLTNLTDWLMKGNIDFDYMAESLLEKHYVETDGAILKLAEAEYQVVVIPPVRNLRKSTVKILIEFVKKGGKVIFTGDSNFLVDLEESKLAKQLFDASIKSYLSPKVVINELEEFRDVDILKLDGTRDQTFLYQKRVLEDGEWVFIAPTEYEEKRILRTPQDGICNKVNIVLNGTYSVEEWNTLEGKISPLNVKHEGGKTIVNYGFYPITSLLIKLTKLKEIPSETLAEKDDEKTPYKAIDLFSDLEYSLDEKNCAVLDMASWSLDGKNYNKREELRRVDDELRKIFELEENSPQPYIIKDDKILANVYLKFSFEAEEKFNVELAYEYLDKVILNGKLVAVNKDGYFTDRFINKMPLGMVKKGKNELVCVVPFSKIITIENLFLLGDFGVRVNGANWTLTKLPKKINFGSINDYGLSFYGGAITYKIPFDCEKGSVKITADKYDGTLISAKVDGKEVGKIVFSPYQLLVDNLEKGNHTLELKLYLSRHNSFSPIHNCSYIYYVWPGTWYPDRFNFSYEYQLRDYGIMKSPVLEFFSEKVK